MNQRYLLVTNNPKFQNGAEPTFELRLVNSGSMDILVMGRDLLHQGWALMNSPLYGNFRPYQQPFRSLLLRSPGRDGRLDEYGLQLLEGALDVYANCGKAHVTPQECHPRFRDDYEAIDWELLQETLLKCGLAGR